MIRANIATSDGEQGYDLNPVEVTELFEIEGRKFFTHVYYGVGVEGNVICGFRVTEWYTGHSFVSCRKTAEEAKDAAVNLLKEIGVDKFDARIKECIEKHGECNK
jgi:hypothetical protein